MLDLSFIWAGLIAFAVLAYVVLDGFDLGVGVLHLFIPRTEDERRNLERAVAHHIKSMIGVSAAVVAKKPGEVPRSQGKAVRVRDLRPKDV